MRPPRRHLFAALVTTAALFVAGCGDDGGSDGASEPAAAPADGGATDGGAADGGASDGGASDGGATDGGGAAGGMGNGDIAEAIGGQDARDAIDALGIDRLGETIVSVSDATRYEVDGNVLHLWLEDDSPSAPMMLCMVAKGVINEDTSAVVHDHEGTEHPC